MNDTAVQPLAGDQEQEILELLQEVDEQAARQESRWTEKRASARRPVRTPCEVRFIAPDGETVLYTMGKTREISAGGLSFIGREHFTRRTPLLITISVLPGRNRSLPARVVYSRSVREGWFLTGVQFGAVSDERLAPRRRGEIVAVEASSQRRSSAEDGNVEMTPRRRMLQMLAAASVPGRRSRGMTAKVVMASVSSDHVVRRAAIPVLLSIGGREATLALIPMLQDTNPVIQGEAAEALGMIGTPQAIEPLRQLLTHRDTELAIRAAEALARMGDWSGKRVIKRALQEDGPASRRAARALGFLVKIDFRPCAEGVAEAREYLRHNVI